MHDGAPRICPLAALMIGDGKLVKGRRQLPEYREKPSLSTQFEVKSTRLDIDSQYPVAKDLVVGNSGRPLRIPSNGASRASLRRRPSAIFEFEVVYHECAWGAVPREASICNLSTSAAEIVPMVNLTITCVFRDAPQPVDHTSDPRVFG